MISVLYVDDETALLEITKLFLERFGDFSVDTAESAREALGKLKTREYDAVVSDYQMPEMDGIAFLKELRKQYPALPFIIFTGRGREEIVIEAFESGADFYLQKGGAPKPQFAELARKITTIVGGRKSAARVVVLNRLYSVLSATNRAIIHRRNVKELMDEICRIAIDIGGFRMVWAGRLNPETRIIEPFSECGFIEGYLDRNTVSVENSDGGSGPTGTAYREGRYTISNDLATDPRMAPWKEDALERGYRSIASFPYAMGTKYSGTLTLYAAEPGFFDDQILRLLDEMTGDITFALKSLEDEEQREIAEEDLRRNEEKYRNIFDIAPNLIVSVDRAGIVLDCNRQVTEVLGYDRKELTGRQVLAIIHPEHREKAAASLDEILGTGSSAGRIFRMIRKDGSTIDVSISGSGQKDRSGADFGAVLIIADITRHLRMEEDLIRRNENLGTAYQELAATEEEIRQGFEKLRKDKDALEESGELFVTLAENLPDIVARFDRSLRCIFVNNRIEEGTGIPPASFSGRTSREAGMPEILSAFWDEHVGTVLAGRNAAAAEVSFSGARGPKQYACRFIPELSSAGKVRTVLVICREMRS